MCSESQFNPQRLKKIAEMEQWHFWFAGRQELVGTFLRQCLAPNTDYLLDLGCGTGFLLTSHDGKHRVVGLDLLMDGLHSTRKMEPSALLLQGEAVKLPFKNEVLNGILMLDVLEHVDDFAALKEASRVLKPDGWLILSVPAMQWLWSYRDRAAGHLRRYTKTRLRLVLNSSGFRLDVARYYQFFLFPLVVASRLLGRNKASMRDLEERRSVLNSLLVTINKLEARLSRRVSWPWGSSIIAVCHKSPVGPQ